MMDLRENKPRTEYYEESHPWPGPVTGLTRADVQCVPEPFKTMIMERRRQAEYIRALDALALPGIAALCGVSTEETER